MTRNLKSRVEYVLEKFPKTRDNDTTLILALYDQYYRLSWFLQRDPERSRQKLFEIMEYDAPDDIIRWRRHIQNKELKFLPTTEEIMRKRRMNIERCREALGYPSHVDTL